MSSQRQSFTDRTLVVSGGSRGIGILSRPARDINGECFIDADVLTAAGVADLSRYGGGENPILDLFLDKT